MRGGPCSTFSLAYCERHWWVARISSAPPPQAPVLATRETSATECTSRMSRGDRPAPLCARRAISQPSSKMLLDKRHPMPFGSCLMRMRILFAKCMQHPLRKNLASSTPLTTPSSLRVSSLFELADERGCLPLMGSHFSGSLKCLDEGGRRPAANAQNQVTDEFTTWLTKLHMLQTPMYPLMNAPSTTSAATGSSVDSQSTDLHGWHSQTIPPWWSGRCAEATDR